MKKLLFFVVAALSITLPLRAENEKIPEDAPPAAEGEGMEEEAAVHKKSRLKDRGFELGLAGIRFGVGNNVLGIGEIFSETLVLDLDELGDGLKADMNLDINPLYFRVNRDKWGFGLDLGRVTAYGNLDISGNLLKLRKISDDEFGVGAAAFVDIGIPVFFHLNKFNGFKITIRPAGFIPIAYMTPDVRYSSKESADGSTIEVDYTAKLYTVSSLNPDSSQSMDFSMGVDFSTGVEYPLYDWLDLGVDIINIPLIPGSLSQYMEVGGGITLDAGKVKFNGDVLEDVLNTGDDTDAKYGSDRKYILRPFKMVFYSNYRPLHKEMLTLIPRLGFAFNPVYTTLASLEAGANVRYDLNNRFIAAFGINYEDRMWKNSLDFAVNFRAFELDIGASMQSPSFLKSWQFTGFGLDFGLKFGW